MNFPAASSGVSIGKHLNRPKGRGIKPLSAYNCAIWHYLWRIERAQVAYAAINTLQAKGGAQRWGLKISS